MAGYLFDTNTWSAMVRRTAPALSARVEAMRPGQLYLSAIVEGELRLGYYKGDRTPPRWQVVEDICAITLPLPVDSATADRYAQLRATLERAGTPIGPNDCWIAAQGLQHGLTVITANTREFARVPGLAVENWL